MSTGPLSGYTILEVGHMLAGPYCGLILADLGAEVIKIEAPGGEIGRTTGRHQVGQHNAYFASLNRNKRGVVIDLASPKGKAEFHGLCRTAHALVTNLRPAAIHKLGLHYSALSPTNPRLVCVALTGFGLNSPWADRPAYDYIVQAMTGIMELTGEPGAWPTKTGYSAVDNSAGAFAAIGLLSQLLSGKGGQVDVAMYDVMLSQLNYIASALLNGNECAQRYGSSAHPYFVPAQVFKTRDRWLVLFITHDGFWRLFCEEIGRPAWITDTLFDTVDARDVARRIRSAGAIFVGAYSPVSLGDYCAGSNHVLPTAGCARHSSGLSVQTFLKGIHVVDYDEAALKDVSGYVITLSQAENLPAHGEAVRRRFET